MVFIIQFFSYVRRQKAIDTGYIIGSAIQRAYDLNDPSIKVKNIELGEVPKLGYLDFNTNRASTFFRGSWDKEVQLAFLHLLSLINFEKYILESVLPAGNEWLFRIKYVVLHYTILGIDSIYRHCNSDNKMSELETEAFQKLTRDKWTLFSSDFRGCMMHYRLRDKNHTPLIKEKIKMSGMHLHLSSSVLF